MGDKFYEIAQLVQQHDSKTKKGRKAFMYLEPIRHNDDGFILEGGEQLLLHPLLLLSDSEFSIVLYHRVITQDNIGVNPGF